MLNFDEIRDTYSKRFTELYTEEEFRTMKHAVEAMKISPTHMVNAMNYQIVPTPKTLCKIADYFNCSIEYLLGQSDDNYFEKSKSSNTFYQVFCMLREERGVTCYQIGKALGIETTSFSAWKRKGSIPSLENLDLLADYFDCSIDFLLGRTDNRKN